MGCNVTWTFHLLPGLKWGLCVLRHSSCLMLLQNFAERKNISWHGSLLPLPLCPPLSSLSPLLPSPVLLLPKFCRGSLSQPQPPARIPVQKCAEGHQDEELGLPLHIRRLPSSCRTDGRMSCQVLAKICDILWMKGYKLCGCVTVCDKDSSL